MDPAPIIDSVVDGITVVIAAAIAAGWWRTNSRVKRVQDQVENHHDTNMRIEQDERHAENATTLAAIRQEVRSIRSVVDSLLEGFHSNRDRIRELEDTQESSVSKRRRTDGHRDY